MENQPRDFFILILGVCLSVTAGIAGCGQEDAQEQENDGEMTRDQGVDMSRQSRVDISSAGGVDMAKEPVKVQGPCEADRFASGGECLECPAGSTRRAGDVPADGDTMCQPTRCDEGFSVQQHACVRCPPGFVRAAGDDATKEDTLCEGTGHQTLAAGQLHTCALTYQKGVTCWGNNIHGQLGDGTQITRSTPTEVEGLEDVIEVVAGSAHTCALTRQGDVFCWGLNKDRELGSETVLEAHPNPLKVQGLPEIASLSSSAYHTCALSREGKAYCWGSNSEGQIHYRESVKDTLPHEMTLFSLPLLQISAGRWHTCALLEDQSVECTGGNRYGELGAKTSQPTHNTRINVPFGAVKVKGLKLGQGFGCALGHGGEVRCWGGNTSGQLGNGTYAFRYEPGFPGRSPQIASALGVGAEHVCMNTEEGLKCWGNNIDGRLGKNYDMAESFPADAVYTPQHIYTMALGTGHTCVWGSVDGLQCWGNDGSGQLGSGKKAFTYKKTPLALPKDVQKVDISEIGNHACALTKEGEVLCWGVNFNGQLGDGTTEQRTAPVAVKDLGGKAIDVAAGLRRSCAVLEGGVVKCWGFWPLGNGSTESSLMPKNVELGPVGVVSVQAGAHHVCAMTRDNAVYCWGHNYRGQVGPGANRLARKPVQVDVFPDALEFDVAGQRSCVIEANGYLTCWGANVHYRHDEGRYYDNIYPEVQGTGGPAKKVSLGQDHLCVILQTGEVKCSGYNNSGQVGAPPSEGILGPRHLESLGQKGLAISSGIEHSCALLDNGELHCWGSNMVELLSERPGLAYDHIPHLISGFSSPPRALSSGGYTTCALLTDGQTECWGSGQWGLLGDEFARNTHLPVSVKLDP